MQERLEKLSLQGEVSQGSGVQLPAPRDRRSYENAFPDVEHDENSRLALANLSQLDSFAQITPSKLDLERYESLMTDFRTTSEQREELKSMYDTYERKLSESMPTFINMSQTNLKPSEDLAEGQTIPLLETYLKYLKGDAGSAFESSRKAFTKSVNGLYKSLDQSAR